MWLVCLLGEDPGRRFSRVRLFFAPRAADATRRTATGHHGTSVATCFEASVEATRDFECSSRRGPNVFNAEIFVSVANWKGRSVAGDSANYKPIQKVPNMMNPE